VAHQEHWVASRSDQAFGGGNVPFKRDRWVLGDKHFKSAVDKFAMDLLPSRAVDKGTVHKDD
jgi:hypothetical protein